MDSENEKSSNRLLSLLLTEMDGILGKSSTSKEHLDYQIIIIATTTDSNLLDPAIIRPGRLDKIVQIPLPDFNARKGLIFF